MKKILITFLILFFSIINLSFAKNLNTEVKTINYNWYYSLTWTTIKVTWENLDTCNKIKFYEKNIKIANKTKNYLEFNSKELDWKLDWVLEFDCNTKAFLEFSFPYIKNYKLFKNNNWKNLILINWKNLSWDNFSAFISWKNLKILEKSNDSIKAFLPNNLDKKAQIYVQNKYWKSNLININDLKYPKIEYIKSTNWFNIEDTIQIYCKNFKKDKDNYLVFNNKNYILNDKNYYSNYIKFKIPNYFIWETEIYLKKWNFESNKIKINIYPTKPIIKQISEWLYNWKKIFIIKWKNFIPNKNLTLYNNNSNLKILKVLDDWTIYSEYKKQNFWNNFFALKNNNILSNIYTIKNNNEKLPFITNVSVEWLTPKNDKRILKLVVNNYDKKTDFVRTNWQNVQILWYYWSILKVLINKNIYKWYIEIYRNNKKVPFIKVFNLLYLDDFKNIKEKQKENAKDEVLVKQITNKNNIYTIKKINNSKKFLISSYSFDNLSNWLIVVNKIIFKVNNYNNEDLWLFWLEVNWEKIISSINKSWEIIFDTPFLIKDNTTIWFLKFSPFSKEGRYDFSLEKIKAKIEKIDYEDNFSNFKIDNKNFSVIIQKEKEKKCINSKNTLINCENFNKNTKNNKNFQKTKINKKKNIIKNSKNKINLKLNKKKLIKQLIISKHNLKILNKSIYTKKFDKIIGNINDKNKLLKIYKKIDSIKKKFKTKKLIKNILDYIQAKIWLKLLIEK